MRDDMRYEEYANSVNAKAAECFRRKPYHLIGTMRQQGKETVRQERNLELADGTLSGCMIYCETANAKTNVENYIKNHM